MRRVMAALLALAALLLAVPALLVGSYGYAAGVLAVLAAGYAIERAVPGSRAADLLLAGHSVVCLFGLFVGVHPTFATVALSLYLFVWNTGHRFAHIQRAFAAPSSEHRLIATTLVRAIIPSLVVALLLTASLYMPASLTYGVGLALSVGALLMIAAFVRLASTHYRGTD